MEEFAFVLEDDGTGWPPASIEWIYLLKLADGYQVKTTPLFIRDMSVDDVINISLDDERHISGWSHKIKSRRSTIWIMVYGNGKIDEILGHLRSLGCNTESFSSHNYYAIDIPADVSFDKVDGVLATLDESVASVAFPSFRHEDKR